ncbi:MAG: hypothetical protein WAM58_11050, partial [Candidatus Acidiferrum sp.]
MQKPQRVGHPKLCYRVNDVPPANPQLTLPSEQPVTRNLHGLLSIPALLPLSKSSRLSALLAKRMKRVSLKFFWKGQQ